jgi:hypothetical protein
MPNASMTALPRLTLRRRENGEVAPEVPDEGADVAPEHASLTYRGFS